MNKEHFQHNYACTSLDLSELKKRKVTHLFIFLIQDRQISDPPTQQRPNDQLPVYKKIKNKKMEGRF